MIEVFILLIAFQIKHFLADYPLQYPYMYENKGQKTGWFSPLRDHAGIHALMTLFIAVVYFVEVSPEMLAREAFAVIALVVLFDFTTHFWIDRWKATRGVGPDKSSFWIYLGLDQMYHHLVGIAITAMLVL